MTSGSYQIKDEGSSSSRLHPRAQQIFDSAAAGSGLRRDSRADPAETESDLSPLQLVHQCLQRAGYRNTVEPCSYRSVRQFAPSGLLLKPKIPLEMGIG